MQNFKEGASKFANAKSAAGTGFETYFSKIGIGTGLLFFSIDIGNDIYNYLKKPKDKRNFNDLIDDVMKSMAVNGLVYVAGAGGGIVGLFLGSLICPGLGFLAGLVGSLGAGYLTSKKLSKYKELKKSY